MNSEIYFKKISDGVRKHYDIAEIARSKGLDPVSSVEIPIAISLAEKCVGLISVIYPQLNDRKIIDRILDLEKTYGQLDPAVAFKIAEEVAREKFCKFQDLMQAIDAGIRVGFSYVTLGVVSSPLEGFTGVKLKKTKDGKDFFAAYFSGPIRSAGTTAGCVVLMIIDYLRETFGFARYDPTEEEVKRYVTENYDYHERVNNLQYLPTEEEITYLAKNLPIQIAGEPTENKEVSNFKDLDRIETNFIRGGMCLIFSEGLAQKAQKGYRLLKSVKDKGFICTGWDHLDGYIELHKKREKKGSDSSPTYIKDIVAGRPVFGHPAASGSFRFRYGRSRTSGFSAMSIHPATMITSGGFISAGTQLKIEKPTKGCTISACEGIDGPIVKFEDESVRKINEVEDAKKSYEKIKEIIYFGDLLVPLGDVINRNYELIKPGYVEEWWELELKNKGGSVENKYTTSLEHAQLLSKEFEIPLHPNYIFYWSQINIEQFLGLIDWFRHGSIVEDKFSLPYSKTDREKFIFGKRALELLGCPHDVSIENVIISPKDKNSLFINLGIDYNEDINFQFASLLNKINSNLPVLETINSLSNYKIKDKAGTFIGARMGRPEKAKLRKLIGSPHVIFPVGVEGGRMRSFQSAVEAGSVKSDFPLFYCSACKKETVYPKCESCGNQCKKLSYCPVCEKNVDSKCNEHDKGFSYKNRRIDIKSYFEVARKMTGTRIEELPAAIKGVRGTSSEDHSCENLSKGLLRAKYNLHVNKDGTIRYDMTEMPVTHFKPKEIGTSIDLLRKLGYEFDINGDVLQKEDQILEIFPHDIILPACPDSADENADDVFIRVSKFIDDELEKIYGLEKFFNINKRSELIGALFACIAPHICNGVVGRVIGFSKTQSLLASPYIHAAMRRDCDGDEAAVMLLMDMLLNFSRKFLPAHRGGTQDAPLVLNSKINAGEVDDQILDFEVVPYPLELYQLAEQGKHSSEIKIETVRTRLKEGKDPFSNISFTHDCSDFNSGVVHSSYKSLPTMSDKVGAQMKLCKKLRGVDTSDVARLIIERHFIRDIRGNLRKFSMQGFRCVGCNEKFRRVPLAGKCTACGGRIIFTISQGSIVKYLASALELARTYKVSPYLLECLEVVEKDIEGIFGKEKEKQEALAKWF